VRAKDACVHAPRCLAGCGREGRRVGGWPSSSATRTVMSYLLGGLVIGSQGRRFRDAVRFPHCLTYQGLLVAQRRHAAPRPS
jgi:hypothetical protein